MVIRLYSFIYTKEIVYGKDISYNLLNPVLNQEIECFLNSTSPLLNSD